MRILKIRTEKERQQILRGKEKKKKETNWALTEILLSFFAVL